MRSGEAVKAMNRLRVRREEDKLTLQPKRSPTFEEYAQGYLDPYRVVKDAKRPATLRAETVCLRRWHEHFGPELRVWQVAKAHINGFMAWRQSQDVSARTVNMELVVLRNVLRKAVDYGYRAALPIEGVKVAEALRREAPAGRLKRSACRRWKCPRTAGSLPTSSC